MKDLKITLYDIFGYLLPGGVFLAGIAILFWAMYIPLTPLAFVELTKETWILILLIAYLMGHMTQALGNLLMKAFTSPENAVLSKGTADGLPDILLQSTKTKASRMLGIDLKDINPEWLFKICDETVVQSGTFSDREVFQYREGFYRGLVVSLVLLFLSLIIRAKIPGASIKISGMSSPISGIVLVFFIIIVFTGILLTFFRYRRFARHRVTQAVIGFLVLKETKSVGHHKEGMGQS